MKKYILALAAIVLAICFSGFTKNYAIVEFSLLTEPNSANIVNDPNEWSTNGTLPGRCDAPPPEIACSWWVKTTTMSGFYHSLPDGSKVPNDFTYANAQTPKKCYVVITE